MDTWGTIVVVVLAVALIAVAGLLLVRSTLPWTAIFVAALTSAICFAVGGGSSEDNTGGPNGAVVAGSIVGFISVVAAILALVPSRDHTRPARRTPLLLSVAAIVVGAVALVLTQV